MQYSNENELNNKIFKKYCLNLNDSRYEWLKLHLTIVSTLPIRHMSNRASNPRILCSEIPIIFTIPKSQNYWCLNPMYFGIIKNSLWAQNLWKYNFLTAILIDLLNIVCKIRCIFWSQINKCTCAQWNKHYLNLFMERFQQRHVSRTVKVHYIIS